MNVLFDPQVFSFQEHGGISRYYCELFKQFSQTEGMKPSLLVRYSNNWHLPELQAVQVKHFFSAHRFKGRNEIIKFLNRRYVKQVFSSLPMPDVFHPTYYHPYFLDLLGDIPFVLTIYDMSHELYPALFNTFDYTAAHKKIVAAKAKRIIAISENTKRDIVTLLHIPASKIDVIPLATTLSPALMRTDEHPLPDNYILYVGKRNTYKNFFFLLDAMEILAQSHPQCHLLCVGGGRFNGEEQQAIEQRQLTKKIIQREVDDASLAYFYVQAQAFVFPSMYEGFGIPTLEAFACGCPVLLSNRSSLPEVGGTAARYFDPEHVSDLVEQLVDVLDHKALADEMRTLGWIRVQLFSWEQTALKTIETYKQAVRP